MLQAQTKELLDSKLIEFSNRKYASFIIMYFKKDIFNNWTKRKYVAITSLSKREQSQIDMSCLPMKKYLIPLGI